MSSLASALVLKLLGGQEVEDSAVLNTLSGASVFIISWILQKAAQHARLAHRNHVSIFDIVSTWKAMGMSVNELLHYLVWLRMRSSACAGSARALPQLSQACRARLSFATGLDKQRVGSERYPPFPLPHTYKATAIYGKRNDDTISILTRRIDEKLRIEQNLFHLLQNQEQTQSDDFGSCVHYDPI